MNLLDGFKPLLFLSRIFGMAPFRARESGLEKSRWFALYSWILFLLNFFCQGTFVFFILSRGSFGLVKGLIQSLDSVTFALNCLGCTFLMLLRWNRILDSIRSLDHFCGRTQFLPENRLIHLRRLSLILSWFSLAFSSVFSVTDGIVWSKNVNLMPRGIILYMFLCGFFRIIICYLTCCQFVFFFTLVRFMHSSVNGNLLELRTVYDRRFGGEKIKIFLLNGFRFLIEIDGWIKDLADEWFVTFSLYGVCVCAVVLFEVVYTTVFYYMSSVLLVELITSFLWMFYFLSQFFAVVIVSVSTTQEAEKTANYLHELFIDSDDSELKEEIEIFSLQLLHRKVEFNACGFFKLDFTLLYSMVGAVTTYIIILMQFQDNDQSPAVPCQMNRTNCSNYLGHSPSNLTQF